LISNGGKHRLRTDNPSATGIGGNAIKPGGALFQPRWIKRWNWDGDDSGIECTPKGFDKSQAGRKGEQDPIAGGESGTKQCRDRPSTTIEGSIGQSCVGGQAIAEKQISLLIWVMLRPPLEGL
jgi:hypothetical protein